MKRPAFTYLYFQQKPEKLKLLSKTLAAPWSRHIQRLLFLTLVRHGRMWTQNYHLPYAQRDVAWSETDFLSFWSQEGKEGHCGGYGKDPNEQRRVWGEKGAAEKRVPEGQLWRVHVKLLIKATHLNRREWIKTTLSTDLRLKEVLVQYPVFGSPDYLLHELWLSLDCNKYASFCG